MIDSVDIGEFDWLNPKAIWKAANDEPEELAAYLRSGKELTDRNREAIAMLIMGELTDPDRKRGGQKKLHLTPTEQLRRDCADPKELALGTAVLYYREIAERLNQCKSFYGQKDRLIEAVGRKYDVAPEKLRNRIERVKPERLPRPPKPESILEEYHIWWLKEEQFRK